VHVCTTYLDYNERAQVIQKYFYSILPGFIFILSEKIQFTDQHKNVFQIDMYDEFNNFMDTVSWKLTKNAII